LESFVYSLTAATVSVQYEYIGIGDYLFYLSSGQVQH